MDNLSDTCPLIFVYGTLRKDQRAYFNFGLDHAAKFIKTTQIPAVMFHLGGFPGIQLTDDGSVVTGDLLEITDEYVIRRLDMYEGCSERDPDDGLYKRVLVKTVDGDETWVYVINGDLSARQIIKTGDWLNQKEKAA